jgi:hypothetical protein
MHRRRYDLGEPAPFEAARHGRPWEDWPGILPIAAVFALWVALMLGVLTPLGDALVATLQPPVSADLAADRGAKNGEDRKVEVQRAAQGGTGQFPDGERPN